MINTCIIKGLSKTCIIEFAIKHKYLHTSFPINSSKGVAVRQTGTAIKKIMGTTKKQKSYYNKEPTLPKPNILSKGANEGKRSANSRRATVLNKLFMRYVTDLMATGEISSQIVGRGVEINRVQISPDYKVLNVFWMTRTSEDVASLENILHRSAGLLRHQLSQLKVIGLVPIIQFVQDKHYAKNLELDRRLAIADYGEDHVLSDWMEKMKTEFHIFSPLSENEKNQLKTLENGEDLDEDASTLPPMPQNVLGLNHHDILERIQKLVKKSAAVHRQNNEDMEERLSMIDLYETRKIEPIPLENRKSQREALREFLRNRQILQSKANCESKNYMPDMEYILEQQRERHEQFLNTFFVDEEEDFAQYENDFIEEEQEA